MSWLLWRRNIVCIRMIITCMLTKPPSRGRGLWLWHSPVDIHSGGSLQACGHQQTSCGGAIPIGRQYDYVMPRNRASATMASVDPNLGALLFQIFRFSATVPVGVLITSAMSLAVKYNCSPETIWKVINHDKKSEETLPLCSDKLQLNYYSSIKPAVHCHSPPQNYLMSIYFRP